MTATSEPDDLGRHLERLPIGTRYPEIAERAGEVSTGTRQRVGQDPQLYVDATGLGPPVVDLIRRHTRPATVVAVYFTHGDRLTEESDHILLGKAFLVSRLQLLLQTGCPSRALRKRKRWRRSCWSTKSTSIQTRINATAPSASAPATT